MTRESLERSPRLGLARDALAPRRPWVVGGTIRDALLGRPLEDLDLVVEDDPRGAAIELAHACDGHAFELSEEFGAWRVVAPDRSWQADVTPLRGATIETDLALRDFTVNAIATPLAGGDLTDPHGGVADLEAGVLRAVGETAFRDDPLRTLRMARFACELGFDVDERTRVLARDDAGMLSAVSPERSFYELRRLVTSRDPLAGLRLMEEAGVLAVLLPELEALKGVEQNPYHHHDVWGHTLEVLDQLVEVECGDRNRDAEHHQHGYATGDSKSSTRDAHATIVTAQSRLAAQSGRSRYASAALNLASVALPGTSSASESTLSGTSTVFWASCRSRGSSST